MVIDSHRLINADLGTDEYLQKLEGLQTQVVRLMMDEQDKLTTKLKVDTTRLLELSVLALALNDIDRLHRLLLTHTKT